jgi:hypothetical protein
LIALSCVDFRNSRMASAPRVGNQTTHERMLKPKALFSSMDLVLYQK